MAGLGSCIAYGVSDYSGGRASTANDAYQVVVAAQLRSIGLVGIWLLAIRPVPAPAGILSGIGVGIASSVSITLLFRSLSAAPSALVSPLCAVVGGVVSAAIGLAVGETISPLGAVGAVIGLVGVSIPSTTLFLKRESAYFKSIIDTLLAGGASGIAIVLIGFSSLSQLPWLLLFERIATVAVLSARNRTIPLISLTARYSWAIWIVAAGYVIASWSLQSGTFETGLSVTAVIASCYPLVTVICSVACQREVIGRLRILSLLLALSGIVMITFSGRG